MSNLLPRGEWYFDFISPFAYFHTFKLDDLSDRVQLNYRPVLFAGILRHFGQKGPAEIPGKREWTYRWCTWHAEQQGIPFRFPAAHPFNPIPYLRLALAADCRPDAIKAIFAALWTTEADPQDPSLIQSLAEQLRIDPTLLERQDIKDALRRNTEEAIVRNVFGVPSLYIDGEVFWGADSMELVDAYLRNPALFDAPEMRRVTALPVGAAR